MVVVDGLKVFFYKYQLLIYYSVLLFLKRIVNEEEKEIEAYIYDENGNISIERQGEDFEVVRVK